MRRDTLSPEEGELDVTSASGVGMLGVLGGMLADAGDGGTVPGTRMVMKDSFLGAVGMLRGRDSLVPVRVRNRWLEPRMAETTVVILGAGGVVWAVM